MVDNDDPIMVRQIINAAGYDTETGIYGVGYSPDNGKTFYVQNTSAGRKFRQQDADGLWPFLIDKIKSIMSIDWDSIQNKPKFVTPDELEARLDKLSVPTVKWADIEDKPPIPSIDGLAKQSDLDNVKATADSAKSKAEQAQSTADANTKALQNVYTKEEADQKYWTAEQEQNASNVKPVNNIEPDDQGNVDIDLTGYAKTSDIPKTMDWSQIIGKPNLALSSDIPSLDGYAKESEILRPQVSEWSTVGVSLLDGTVQGSHNPVRYRVITLGNLHRVEVTGWLTTTIVGGRFNSKVRIPRMGFENATKMSFSGGSTLSAFGDEVAFFAGQPGEINLFSGAKTLENANFQINCHWIYEG